MVIPPSEDTIGRLHSMMRHIKMARRMTNASRIRLINAPLRGASVRDVFPPKFVTEEIETAVQNGGDYD